LLLKRTAVRETTFEKEKLEEGEDFTTEV